MDNPPSAHLPEPQPGRDGGPAFPVPKLIMSDGVGMTEIVHGMSLRDYFAAAALPGVLAQNSDKASPKIAYQIADAMLAERARAKP